MTQYLLTKTERTKSQWQYPWKWFCTFKYWSVILDPLRIQASGIQFFGFGPQINQKVAINLTLTCTKGRCFSLYSHSMSDKENSLMTLTPGFLGTAWNLFSARQTLAFLKSGIDTMVIWIGNVTQTNLQLFWGTAEISQLFYLAIKNVTAHSI